MLPETYRYYHLDGAGHLHDAEWFEAENDEDAIAQISSKHPDSKCEIWRGTRLVASLSPDPFDPDDADLQRAVGERPPGLAQTRRLGLGS
jgi:hypothetical protein